MLDALIFVTDNAVEPEIRDYLGFVAAKMVVVDKLPDVLTVCQDTFVELLIVWPAPPGITSELMNLLEQNGFGYIPVLAVAEDDWTETTLKELPLADVIPPATPKNIFLHILKSLTDDINSYDSDTPGVDMRGSIEEYSLIDLVQMIELNKKDALLTIYYRNHSGSVLFGRGKVLNAGLGRSKGLDALEKLAILPSGHFEVKIGTFKTSDDLIKMSNEELLIHLVETAYKHDELVTVMPGINEDLLANPLKKLDKPSPLQNRILEYAAQPLSLMELIIELDVETESIIETLQPLLESENIGLQHVITEKLRQVHERSNLDRFFGTFTTLFKRRTAPETEDRYQFFDEGEISEQPALATMPVCLSENEKLKLETKLERLLK